MSSCASSLALCARAETRGVTVLTTHYLEEAELSDRIAIINHGRVIACDTTAARCDGLTPRARSSSIATRRVPAALGRFDAVLKDPAGWWCATSPAVSAWLRS
jgi:ABC-2 type transport system ATP-binding protein